jgi:hypothetical protein
MFRDQCQCEKLFKNKNQETQYVFMRSSMYEALTREGCAQVYGDQDFGPLLSHGLGH